MTADDREWIRRLRSGGPHEFAGFYDRYRARIYRFCFRLSGNAGDAEDLTQEVFIAAFRGLSGFAGHSSLSTWLYRIAYYRWRRLRDARRPETVLMDDVRAAGVADSPFIESTLERMALQSALSSLPPAHRAAVLLVKVEGLTCGEAAEALGIPVGTVKYHVHEAIVRLKALLTADAGGTAERDPREVCDEV